MTGSLFDLDPEQSPELPTPPLRLRRVRLQGVGPDGARFDPLDLDFATGSGAAARVLLSLTNTGGKSTLIMLVCSLIVPAARSQVGGKILGDYVLTGDTSHIVCEWEDSDTGIRTVTGTVMEWKDGRRQPAHKMRSTVHMHRAWYMFRTGANLPGIDDLPFVGEGRRVPYTRFRAAVEDLLAANPDARGTVTDKQLTWTNTLEERTSIDPVLFSYQMRMNDSETGAEQLLSSFNSPENVVRFFVAALNDDRELDTFTDKLGEYATLAAQRRDLEARLNFGTEIVPVVGQMALFATDKDAAESARLRAATAGGEHAGALNNRIAQDRNTLTELEDSVQSTAREFTLARREYGQVSDIRQQLLLEQARARVEEAEQLLTTSKEAEETADASAKSWQAVSDVLDLRVQRAAAEAADEAYRRADAGLEPLRADVHRAAAGLAARLDALAAEADAAASAADEAATAAETEERQALDAGKRAGIRASELSREQTTAKAEIERARIARGKAAAERWYLEHETVGECVQRWQQTRAMSKQLADAAADRERTANERFDEVDRELADIDTRITVSTAHAQAAAAKVEALLLDFAAVRDNETITDLTGDIPDGATALPRIAEIADAAALTADGTAAFHQAAVTAANAQLRPLVETGVAATGDDIITVLGVLTDAGIGSVTGLHWIEKNILDADAREGFILARPDVAGGVIISDATRFGDGVRLLEHSELSIRTPVIVTTPPAPAAGAGHPQPPGRHVVVPHRATWDQKWATETRRNLEETVEREEQLTRGATAAAKRYRAAAGLCEQFIRRWGMVTEADLRHIADTAATKLRAEQSERAELVRERAEMRAAAAVARKEFGEHTRAIENAERKVSSALALESVCDAATRADTALPGIELGIRQARAAETRAAEEHESAKDAYRAAVRSAAGLRRDGESYRSERAGLGVETGAPDPGGNVSVVRTRFEALRRELTDAERGIAEATRLDDARTAVSRAAAKLERYPRPITRHAEELSDTIEASSPTTLIDAQTRATTAYDEAHRTRLKAETDLERAHRDCTAAEPPSADHQNYIDLAATEWYPDGPGAIPQLLERLQVHNLAMLAAQNAAEQAHNDAKAMRDEVRSDIEAIGDTSAMWTADRVPSTLVYAGSATAARELMRENLLNYQQADQKLRAAQETLHGAVVRARTAANDPRFAALESPDILRIRSLPEPALVAEAELLARRISALTESTRADLAQLDSHRSILCDDLVALCRTQRRMLNEVSRSSKLPPGLGNLSNCPAIKIRFEEAPAVEAAARLAARVDAWAVELTGNPKRANSSEVRARWLADAVRDTVTSRSRAGAWSIEILKPRIDGQIAYCPPDRIPHEFSGGQVLTLAVLVYCALSRVRSDHRQGGARPAGTLLLDNPFGAASAETLIQMQHRLAAHTGVQLVCATGLHDPAVEAAFSDSGSVIIKLRNDGDLRRNLSFLRLRAAVVDGVDVADTITRGRDPRSTQNWVDATAYEIRR